ncbi:MAG: hypothetical protein MUP80_11580, partial [Acidobacteriia bacterium]|nr:hypothetical protein [Terriglobia bacterium]
QRPARVLAGWRRAQLCASLRLDLNQTAPLPLRQRVGGYPPACYTDYVRGVACPPLKELQFG